MKNLRWQLLVVVLALVAIAILLLSQRQPLLTGEEPVVQPVSGGEYSEGLIGSLGRLNPLLDYYNPADYDVDRLLYSSLVRFNDRGLPQRDLADDWAISQDGKVYTFSIRRNAIWHDGEPVTSEDVAFTIGLMTDPEAPLPADLREFWEQVEVFPLDEKTLQFRLPEPFAPFLDYLTFGVLPRHLLEGMDIQQIIDSPFNLRPVGSGPYRIERLLVENEVINGVVLKAFEAYYDGKPFIDQVTFQYYPDSAAAMAAYEAGEVMGVSHVDESVLKQGLTRQDMQLFTGRLPRLGLIYLNLDAPEVAFLQDPNVRRALMLGLNRRWIIDQALNGQAIMANSPIFPENWAYYENIEQLPFDSDQAIRILKDAGYTIPADGGSVRSKDGVDLSFELLHPDTPVYTQIAERIRSDWARLGVEVKLVPASAQDILENHLEPHDYQAALAELNLDRFPDPDPYPFWHQAQINGGQNYSSWDDRQASEYLEQGRVIDDLAERTRLYSNFQVRFSQELPALLLFYPVYSYGVKDTVLGATMGPLFDPSDRFLTFPSWYLLTSDIASGAETTGDSTPAAASATPAP